MSHLTKQERCESENFLFAGVTPQKTARNLGRSHTTINRKLKRYRIAAWGNAVVVESSHTPKPLRF